MVKLSCKSLPPMAPTTTINLSEVPQSMVTSSSCYSVLIVEQMVDGYAEAPKVNSKFCEDSGLCHTDHSKYIKRVWFVEVSSLQLYHIKDLHVSAHAVLPGHDIPCLLHNIKAQGYKVQYVKNNQSYIPNLHGGDDDFIMVINNETLEMTEELKELIKTVGLDEIPQQLANTSSRSRGNHSRHFGFTALNRKCNAEVLNVYIPHCQKPVISHDHDNK